MVFHNPEIAPRTSHRGMYSYAFKGLLDPSNNVRSVIDFASGDNDYCLDTDVQSGEITLFRVDAQYKDVPPRDDLERKKPEEWLAADVTNDHAMNVIPDDTFDVSISSFLFQHLSNEGMKKTLNQMRRVTKPSSNTESSLGLIAIYPLYRPRLLRTVVDDHADLLFTPSLYIGLEEEMIFRDFKYSTLVLRNDNEKPEELDEVVERVAESGALRRTPAMRVASTLDKLLISAGVKSTHKTY